MAIRANFSHRDIRDLEASIEREMFEKAIRAYNYIGTQLVNHAKVSVGFMDQTGNLRSSIGYVLFVNGRVHSEYYVSESGGNEGVAEGKRFARELAQEIISNKIVLVVTAGMNYAHAVEAKGYNVLSATENYSKSVVKTMLKQLMR